MSKTNLREIGLNQEVVNHLRKAECKHRYKTISMLDIQNDKVIYIGVCKKCGQMDQ
ncbi:MAG: hypothetical protein Q7K65_02380 [Candidatus Buchananbacteria bacterium]|nr:hypothetical protein [Candidatus Buchananbacteria bacterium]